MLVPPSLGSAERCGDLRRPLALVPVNVAGSAASLAPDDCGVLHGSAVLLQTRLLLSLAALHWGLSHNIINSGLYFTWNAASCSLLLSAAVAAPSCSRLLGCSWLLRLLEECCTVR